MTTVLVILSVLCITAYTAVVCIACKGIPDSISETFYKLEHKAWFTITMFATAFFLVPAILEVTPASYQFVAFLACVGLCFVGAAPNFKEGIEKKVHTAGAIICIVFSQVWVALTCPWLLFVWLAYIAYTGFSIKKNWKGNFISAFYSTNPTFWIEITALISTYVTLFLEI